LKQISLKVGVNHSKINKISFFFGCKIKNISKLGKFYFFALRSFVNFDPGFFD